MNEAATATAIFPFIGMNRSTNPINLDHPPNPLRPAIINTPPKNQPPPRHRRTRRTTRDRHQPRDRQPTTAINPTTARAGTDEPIPGPFRTSHHPTPPPKPLIPRGRTRKRQPPPRAKQPAPAGRGKPDRFTSDHERSTSTSRNSETRNRLPNNAGLSPTGEPIQDLETPEPQRSTAEQIGTSPRARGSVHQLALLPRPIPSHAGREHNEEVDRRADAESGDQQRTPSNTPATGDTPIRARTPLKA